METTKKYLISLGLTGMLLVGVLTAKGADPIENLDLENMYGLENLYDLENMYDPGSIQSLNRMLHEIENVVSEEDRVQIYDSKDQLIADGVKNEDKIRSFLGISDFLTEIDGIQYYRLSYK
jgi:hypothetical protein